MFFTIACGRLIPSRPAVLVGTVAYLFGWLRLGVMLHVGALQRSGALVFYPLCFSLFCSFCCQSSTSRQRIALAIALTLALLAHPALFIFLVVILIVQRAGIGHNTYWQVAASGAHTRGKITAITAHCRHFSGT